MARLLRVVGRVTFIKGFAFAVLPAGGGYLVFRWLQGTIEAASVAGGVSALVAVVAAVYVLHPRLNYRLVRRKTRRTHNAYVAWLAVTISNANVVLIGSRGRAGARTHALGDVHLTGRGLPFVPPSTIDAHFDVSPEDQEQIAAYKKAAEEVIGTKNRPLEDPRLAYQVNLVRALGCLMRGVGFELGGHGYVTDLWRQNLEEWVVCAQRQHRALKRALGPAAPEEQLLNLLDRLSTSDFYDNATKPLKDRDLVRIWSAGSGWSGTLKLTSDPQLVNRRTSGLPVWELEIIDAIGTQATFTVDRTEFEPAPSG